MTQGQPPMKQLALDIGLAPVPSLENFIDAGNEDALEHLRLWTANPMRSPVPTGGGPRIRAVLERWRGETSVMLSDLEPHRPPIYAQVPQPAFPAMIAALEAFSHG